MKWLFSINHVYTMCIRYLWFNSNLLKWCFYFLLSYDIDKISCSQPSRISWSQQSGINLQKFLGLNRSGRCLQRFERALSWGMMMWCNLSRQTFKTTEWVWFQISSHTLLPEFRGKKKPLDRFDSRYPPTFHYQSLGAKKTTR